MLIVTIISAISLPRGKTYLILINPFTRIRQNDYYSFGFFASEQFIQFIAANVTEILTFDEVEIYSQIFWQRSPIRSMERAQNSAVRTLGIVRESSIM